MTEVDLNVVCKHCGAEVSPYITECPYCGQRLRKRAPKLKQGAGEVEVRQRRLRLRPRRRRGTDRPLAWLEGQRPYGTIALILAPAVLYLVYQVGNVSLYDLGAIAGRLDGDVWRLGAAQFLYENVGYLFAVCIAVGIFGSSLERRYGAAVPILLFVAAGALGLYLTTVADSNAAAIGGNGSALGLICAWLVRDLRDRRSGHDPDTDLLGAAAIAAVLAVMPLLEPTASWWAALGGAATGAVAGLVLPSRP
jgi:membrane associated rhomboid family serine protease